MQQASVTLPCSASPGKLDLSWSVRFRAALLGRAPQRDWAGSSVQFKRRSEAERAQVPAAVSRPMRFRSGREKPLTSKDTAGLSKFERLMGMPQWVRARSSGQFERRSEAKASSIGQFGRPSNAEAGSSGPFERPSEAEVVSSGQSKAPERGQAGWSDRFPASQRS